MDTIHTAQDGQSALLARFAEPDIDYGLYAYYTPPDLQPDEKEIADFVRRCAERGIRGIIPRLSPIADAYAEKNRVELPIAADRQIVARAERQERELAVDRTLLAFYRRVYRALLMAASGTGVQIVCHLERPLEHMVVRAAPHSGMRAYALTRREYYMNQEQSVSLLLSDKGKRMSVVAVDLRDGDMIDLRDCVTEDGMLRWEVPTGNWCVQEFLCRSDPSPHADYMSAAAGEAMLEAAYALLSDLYEESGVQARVLCMSAIGYHAPNHRSWSPAFNERFLADYGIDPAPWYPHLYDAEDDNTPRLKALMFSYRAAMLRQGIYRALETFCQKHGMQLLGSALEPKFAAPSGLSGDALANAGVLPGALLDRAYMYGINSLKIAAAGAYNNGRETVCCEFGRNYSSFSRELLYKDAINAMARGANLLMAHCHGGREVPDQPYADFVRRSCALLREGQHVSDIAMVYPIHSLHASVSFYEAAADRFEYPDLPTHADYVTLINAFLLYAGQDVTLLHPDTLRHRCTVREDGALIFDDGQGRRYVYRVVVLPSSRLLSLAVMRLLRRFFEAGGKIIATGEALPARTVSLAESVIDDAELISHVRAVFGEEALNPDVVAGRLYRQNESGGVACWLYPGKTAADGTLMVDSAMVARSLYDLGLAQDVYIPAMPRRAATGILGSPYPEFAALGLDHVIPGGGMLSHIHKTVDGCELYYFGNSMDTDFEGEVLLRGDYQSLVRCDPATGACEPLPYSQAIRHGCSYSRIHLHVGAISACFILAQ